MRVSDSSRHAPVPVSRRRKWSHRRGSTPLTEGDVVTPIYNVLYEDEDGELQEMTMDGDPIVAGKDGSIDFGFYSLEGSDATYLYCFCLTDIYGEIQLSDFINFEL